jgi:hypothetical protein
LTYKIRLSSHQVLRTGPQRWPVDIGIITSDKAAATLQVARFLIHDSSIRFHYYPLSCSAASFLFSRLIYVIGLGRQLAVDYEVDHLDRLLDADPVEAMYMGLLCDTGRICAAEPSQGLLAGVKRGLV